MPSMPPVYQAGAAMQARAGTAAAARIRQSRKWTRFSVRLRKDNPLCQAPGHRGPIAAVESVHHFQPLAERPDLAFAESNCWCLCAKCHQNLSTIEREQGTRAAQVALLNGTA